MALCVHGYHVDREILQLAKLLRSWQSQGTLTTDKAVVVEQDAKGIGHLPQSVAVVRSFSKKR